MAEEIKSYKDISPVMITGLVAALITSLSSVKLLVMASEITKAMFTGFMTGALATRYLLDLLRGCACKAS